MKRIDKMVFLVVILFVAVAILKTTLDVAAQLAPFVAGIGVLYLLGRLYAAGKLDWVKASFIKMMKPAPEPEPAERK